jgi:hypothetical protein
VLQDRLTSELRLAQARDLDSANAVLRLFLADYNRRFARRPREMQTAWRPAPENLDRICCFVHQRVVSNDNIVRGRANASRFPSKDNASALPEPKSTSIKLSTGASRPTTATPAYNTPWLRQGDTFTLPLG